MILRSLLMRIEFQEILVVFEIYNFDEEELDRE